MSFCCRFCWGKRGEMQPTMMNIVQTSAKKSRGKVEVQCTVKWRNWRLALWTTARRRLLSAAPRKEDRKTVLAIKAKNASHCSLSLLSFSKQSIYSNEWDRFGAFELPVGRCSSLLWTAAVNSEIESCLCPQHYLASLSTVVQLSLVLYLIISFLCHAYYQKSILFMFLIVLSKFCSLGKLKIFTKAIFYF